MVLQASDEVLVQGEAACAAASTGADAAWRSGRAGGQLPLQVLHNFLPTVHHVHQMVALWLPSLSIIRSYKI